MAVAERKRTVLSRCTRDGCTKPRLTGERVCFDHLDIGELEAQINEPDEDDERREEAMAPSAPQEVAMPTGSPGQPSPTRRIDPPWACACGRFKTDWPASKAKHLLACDGKPPALSGRIAAGSDSSTSSKRAKPERIHRTPAAKRPRKAARRAVRPRKAKRTGRELVPVPQTAELLVAVPSGGSARLTFLEQLRAARGRIDDAIVAVEGLG